VPLLFETGYDSLVDKTVLVVAPLEQRVARIVERDRIDEGRVRARMAAQIAPEEACPRADFVIENHGNLDHLRDRTRAVYEALS
jgi:dephospho-CoA kinase